LVSTTDPSKATSADEAVVFDDSATVVADWLVVDWLVVDWLVVDWLVGAVVDGLVGAVAAVEVAGAVALVDVAIGCGSAARASDAACEVFAPANR
jgi:hypothetical protein